MRRELVVAGCHTPTVLMHPNNRSVDHLHGGIMGAGECAHDLGPHARSSPANEPIVAGRVRTEVVRQIAPWRPRSQNPKDAIEDTTVIHSWHAAPLIWQHQFDGNPLIVGEFVAHDSTPSVGGLNHGSAVRLNPPGQGALRSLFPPKRTYYARFEFCRSRPLSSLCYETSVRRDRCSQASAMSSAGLPACSWQGSNHHNFNKHPRSPKVGCQTSPRRRVGPIDPLVPNRIVIFE